MIYYIAKYCHVALENKPLNVQSHTFIDIRQCTGSGWWSVVATEGQTSPCLQSSLRRKRLSKFLSISGQFVKQLLLKPDAVPSIFRWTHLSSVDEVALATTATRNVWDEPRSRWIWSHPSHFISPHMFSRLVIHEHIHTVMPTRTCV